MIAKQADRLSTQTYGNFPKAEIVQSVARMIRLTEMICIGGLDRGRESTLLLFLSK